MQRRHGFVLGSLLVLFLASGLGGLAATLDLNHDQAISYTAALRHVSGQVLYKDFSEPHGPLAGWLLTPFVALAPTGGWGVVAATAVLNGAAALLIGGIVGSATGDPDAALQAGLISAFWFTPVFGTYYHDLLAYAWVLGGFLAFVASRSSRRPVILEVVSALLLVCAYQAKQTVGITGLFALGASLVLSEGLPVAWSRPVLRLLLSYVVFQALFLLIIAAQGGLGNYLEYAINLPRVYASDPQNGKSPKNLIAVFVHPFTVTPSIAPHGPIIRFFFPVVVLIYWSYFRLYRVYLLGAESGENGARRPALLAFSFLLLSTLWCSVLLGRRPYDVTFGFAGVAALAWAHFGGTWRRWGLSAGFCALALPLIYAGHVVHFAPDAFLAHTDLWPIRVRYNPYQYDLEATKGIVEFLANRPGKIAVTDEAGYLVPLALGRGPWGPSGYYHKGLTYPTRPESFAAWQRAFIRTLDEQNVPFVVRVDELRFPRSVPLRGSEAGHRKSFGLVLGAPELAAYLEMRYRKVMEINGHTVLERQP